MDQSQRTDHDDINRDLDAHALLDMLFDRMPMVVAVLDCDFRLQRLNPTWVDFAERFSPTHREDIVPGAYYFDIFPGSEEAIKPLFERVLAGETVRQDAVRLETGGFVSYWDIVLAPVVDDNHVVGILDVGIDATEREESTARLRERQERLDLVLRGTNDGIWDWDLQTDRVFYSPRWKSMLGYEEDEIAPHVDSWLNLIHPDDLPMARQTLQAHLTDPAVPYKLEHRLRHKDGFYRWILARGAAVRDHSGEPRRLLGSHTDTTARRRAEGLQAGQQEVLELLATGASLSQTLIRLLQVIEAQSPGMLGLVLLLDEDGRHLHIGAGPSLPQDYLESIEGLEIGPQVGSCGTASYTGDRVIVTDIAVDPRWDNLRDLALHYNLRACWSEPVLAPEGNVIGTFAMYYREPREPTEDELEVIETGAHLAGIAIQRRRADEALRESERRLSTLMSNLPGMAYRCRNEPGWPMTFVSQGSMELTGYAPEQFTNSGGIRFGELIHPDDRDAVWNSVQEALARQEAFRVTYRIVTNSGDEKWVWEQGRGVFDEEDALLALEGLVTDATERVQSQQLLAQRVEERTRELSTLLQVSQDMASTLEPEKLLNKILDKLKTVVDYTGASVLVPRDDVLEVRAYRGPIPQAEALQIRFPLTAAGANREVLEMRAPLCIADVRADTSRAHAFRETAADALATTFGYVRSWLGVPLIARGQLIGMLSLDHSKPDYYSEEHSRLALTFANQVAVTMENARLFTELERRTQAQEALYHADEELYSHLEMDAVLQSLVDVAVELLGADKSSMMVWDRSRQQLVVRAAHGFTPQTIAQMQFRPGEGIVGQVAVSGETAVVEDVSRDSRVAQRITDAEHIRSFMHLPLRLNDEIFGVFNVSYAQPRAFDEEDRRLFTALAQRAALAIENARLYRNAERRADEAQTLVNVQQAITGNRDRTTILQLIADEACRLTDAERTVVFMRRDDALQIAVLSGYEDDSLLGYRMPFDDSLSGLALRRRRPMRSTDAQKDPRVNVDAVQRTGARSVLAAPLLSGDVALGAITALNKAPGGEAVFDDEDEQVMQMLAAGAVIALENARLFEEEQDRRRVAEGLRDMLSVVNANAPLQETLHAVVTQAVRVLDADAGILFRVDQEQEAIIIEAMEGIPSRLQRLQSLPLLDSAANRATLHNEPAIIPDLAADMAAEADQLNDPRLPPEARAWLDELAEAFGAYLSVPFVVQGGVHGDITLYYREPHSFSDEEVSLAVAFGEQASLVAENAHLRIQAEANAASEERTRLARELHDAVTQTLFSASLIAEVVPLLWEKDPQQGRQRLEELRELTRGALAEMRTLLLELRPDTLTETSLPELLRQLSEAATGRSRLPVSLDVSGDVELPSKVQVVFYRIAQESLNNVTKHAAASQVDISLAATPQHVTLSVADDGRGFEQRHVAPNSLGLSIMHERASEIGATLEIEGAVGEGTTVRCRWPVRTEGQFAL